MSDLIKQTILAGIGIAGATKTRIDDLVSEVAQRAEVSESELDAFQKDLEARAAEMRDDLVERIDHLIDRAFIQMGLLKAEAKRDAETLQQGLQELIDSRVDAALERIGVARGDSVEALQIRLEVLEKKLANS